VKRGAWWLVALLGAGAVAGLVLASRRLDAASSTLSRGATGWLAARLYLEKRGAAPVVVDRPLTHSAGEGVAGEGGTWVLAFPWQDRAFELDHEALLAHLGAGGDLVLAYGAEPIPSPAEVAVLDTLEVQVDTQPIPTLTPWRWRVEMAKGWALRPAPRWQRTASASQNGGDAKPAELRLRPPRWLPELRREDALLLGPRGTVVAAAWRERRGRVVVLPAELLANARLADPAHAALLETLHGWLEGPWRFDEYHHGLGAPAAGDTAAPLERGLDLLLLQLLLVYVMAALALGRRLGPAWRETPPLAGSAGGFLLRLGTLHHRLGHHGDGAALLLRRATELDRRLLPDASLRALAERGDASALVEVGQSVARLQRR
jgi:hypothetical protein